MTHRSGPQQFHHNHSIDFQFAATEIRTCPDQVDWVRFVFGIHPIRLPAATPPSTSS